MVENCSKQRHLLSVPEHITATTVSCPSPILQAHVHIIAGEINSGKTAKLSAIYNEIRSGDGFISTKIFDAGLYIGQRIVRLTTRESCPLSFKKEFIPTNWDEEYCYDVYSFSKIGLMFAGEIVSDILRKEIEPIFMDEIGPLELKGRGFNRVLSQLLPVKKDIYITVRNSCVESVIKEFNIKKHKIINV